MPSATSPSEKNEEKSLAGDVKPAPRKRPAKGVLATLRGWRYLYELWTGLYMLEFWEKCLFGALLGALCPSLLSRAVRANARSPSHRASLPAARPLALWTTDGIVTAVLLLLAYAAWRAWRLAAPVVAALV